MIATLTGTLPAIQYQAVLQDAANVNLVTALIPATPSPALIRQAGIAATPGTQIPLNVGACTLGPPANKELIALKYAVSPVPALRWVKLNQAGQVIDGGPLVIPSPIPPYYTNTPRPAGGIGCSFQGTALCVAPPAGTQWVNVY